MLNVNDLAHNQELARLIASAAAAGGLVGYLAGAVLDTGAVLARRAVAAVKQAAADRRERRAAEAAEAAEAESRDISHYFWRMSIVGTFGGDPVNFGYDRFDRRALVRFAKDDSVMTLRIHELLRWRPDLLADLATAPHIDETDLHQEFGN